jgi:SAM-dependent MidA family methyltransferase
MNSGNADSSLDIPADWPTPSGIEIERHRSLVRLIRKELDAAGGAIPFARFMNLALYAPGLGYYSATQPKFGESGDFVTAPELSPLFGRCLANQVMQILSQLGDTDILEVGAGSGALAAELLRSLETKGQLPKRYLILELSAGLRAWQKQTLERRVPQLASRVQWINELPTGIFDGIVIGNELLDAMPASRFRVDGANVTEEHVEWHETGFRSTPRAARNTIAARVAALALADGYVCEIGLQAEAWIRSIGERLGRGAVLLLDYGFPRAEFYHAQRSQGTLMCHYRHRAHANPFALVGLQDITVHVDFTAIAEAGHDAGLDVLGYTSQAAFLIGCGVAEMALEPAADEREQLARSHAITKLTAPHEMGELFKAIAFGRGVQTPLRGFVVQDRRSRL